MKICSLLPGATEVIAALGLADHLVGISHECDFPPAVQGKPVLVIPAIEASRAASREIDRQVVETLAAGQRLYALDERSFVVARPDLVITQDLCQVCAVTPDQLDRALEQLTPPPRLLTLNPLSLADVLADVARIGNAVEQAQAGQALAARLRTDLESVRRRVSGAMTKPRVACLEWLDPLYIGGHWVPEMVEWAGGQDLFGSPGRPSRKIAWEQVRDAAPDIIVIMSCGFSVARTLAELSAQPPAQRWPGWDDVPAVRSKRVYVVDAASYFSRPGPRLVEGVAILAALLHPDLCAEHERPTPQQAHRLA
ncbi:MAG: hypothetical protein A4S17_01255 [Proteobacteria bacterium HN_bin10]|nr:MAG: hypothetical protein A4S17_01255 [Proteobacteria bacterium HN_bin10]